jgi:glycosyltransferase involved in cell wall biosynthesis
VSGGLDARFGGPSSSAIATSVAVRRCGVANRFVFPFEGAARAEGSPMMNFLHAARVATTPLPLSGPRLLARRWGFSLSFVRWFVRNVRGYDVIHAHGSWTFTTLIALAVGRLSRQVMILTPHESLTDFDISRSPPVRRIIKRALRRLYLRAFDAVVTSSRLEQADTDAGRRRPFVVFHAVVASAELRARNSARKPSFVIGYLGRLDPKKNVEMLLDALAHLPPHTRMIIAGQGTPEYEKTLYARARKRRIDHRVEWWGFVGANGKRTLFESVDVLAMPSAYECFGLVAAEGMMAGVPLLISSRSGVAEVAARHDAAIVVEPTLHAVVAGLRRAERQRESLSIMGVRGRLAAQNEFSLDTHGARLVKVYEHALARRRTTFGAQRRAMR